MSQPAAAHTVCVTHKHQNVLECVAGTRGRSRTLQCNDDLLWTSVGLLSRAGAAFWGPSLAVGGSGAGRGEYVECEGCGGECGGAR